jgi:hypothetical protein
VGQEQYICVLHAQVSRNLTASINVIKNDFLGTRSANALNIFVPIIKCIEKKLNSIVESNSVRLYE